MRAWGFLKNRAMVASLGAALVFSIGAGVAVSQITHHAAPAGQANTASASTDTTTTSADATATAGSGSGGDATATAGVTATIPPTATTIPPTATPRPQPTPTSVPPGQKMQIQGRVNSILSANSFTVQVGSLLYTVVVNADGTTTNIQINGRPQTNLNNLESGMDANVTGQGRSDNSGSILASTVDVQDN